MAKGGVCDEGACVAGGHVFQGGMHGRGHAWQECVCGGGVHGRGACVAGGHAWQGSMCGRRDSHCSGRYASYWNALLCLHPFNQHKQSPQVAKILITSTCFLIFAACSIGCRNVSPDICSVLDAVLV